jgi:hypothetical protein
MSLRYDAILKELEEKVSDSWRKTCIDAHISPDTQFVAIEVLEESKHYPRFNAGMIILMQAMSEFKYFRYLQHTTVESIEQYLIRVRTELK